jgi:hypothetical protein
MTMSKTITLEPAMRVLEANELDAVSGGAVKEVYPHAREVAMMLFNGVLDPLWEITGRGPTPPN